MNFDQYFPLLGRRGKNVGNLYLIGVWLMRRSYKLLLQEPDSGPTRLAQGLLIEGRVTGFRKPAATAR